MSQLFSQLGIDWRLLIAQAVNFFLLLAILRIFVYKPLLKLLHDRRQKIEDGLAKAKEAEVRLHEVDFVAKKKIKDAETEALRVMQKVERDAKEHETALLLKAQEREAAAMKGADERARAREEESRRAIAAEAAGLVKQAIVRTVKLSPEAVDDVLVARAVKEIASAS